MRPDPPRFDTLEPRTLFSAGDLDNSFGTHGVIVYTDQSQAWDLETQADGKLLFTNSEGLHRFNPDGTPDETWGPGGERDVGFPAGNIEIDAAGRIVVSGRGGSAYTLARLNPDGSFDTSFGNGGKVVTQVADTFTQYGSVVGLTRDGKIVVLGTQLAQPFDPADPDSLDIWETTIVRFNADGSVDTTFAGDGEYTSRTIDRVEGAAVAADGRVVFHGQVNSGSSSHQGTNELIGADGHVLRFADPGGGGTFTYSQDRAAVFRPDGTLVIGSSSVGFSGARFDEQKFTQLFFNPLDPDDATSAYVNHVVNAGGNKALVAGYGGDTSRGVGLARLNADGSPDKTFGFGGVEEIDLNRKRTEWIDRVAIAPDGSIYAAGVVAPRDVTADDEYIGGPLFLAKFEGGARTPGTRAPVASYSPAEYPTRPFPDAPTHEIQVVYAAEDLIDKTTLDDWDVQVIGPGGFTERARLLKIEDQYGGQRRVVTYAIDAPGGTWNRADNGFYDVYLRKNQVYDNFDNRARGQLLGTFKSYFPKGRHPGAAPAAATTATTNPATPTAAFAVAPTIARRSDVAPFNRDDDLFDRRPA